MAEASGGRSKPGWVCERSSQEEGHGWRAAVGGVAARAFRAGRVGQGAGAADGVVAQHDQAGVAVRSEVPPRYERCAAGSKLDPFKDEIHQLLKDDAKLTGVRVREEIEPLGYDGGKTIVDDYLREVRPLFLPTRTFQQTVYRPGGICQFDLWQPSREVLVGHGQTRLGYVVFAALGYSRVGAGALVFSKEAVDILLCLLHARSAACSSRTREWRNCRYAGSHET